MRYHTLAAVSPLVGIVEGQRAHLTLTHPVNNKKAETCDAVLAFETGKEGEGTVARRGLSSWTIEVTGPTGHSSGVFSAAMGSGAIYEAARIIQGFHTELRKLPGLTANVATMHPLYGAEFQAFLEKQDALYKEMLAKLGTK